jgi:Na+/H+-dicarboxylate symporter
MTTRWWHILILLAIGYALGYWMPKLGDVTLMKIYPRG